ncbi:MAG TPA: AI-2E family transporter YdiK [Gemmatimonadales bacterium]
MSTSTTDTGLVRNVLAVLFLAVLTASTYYILAPFLAAVIWAITIATATWPRLLWLQGKFGGRRGPAAAVFTLLLLSIVVVPVVAAVVLIVGRSDDLVNSIATLVVPPAPSWVEGLPLVGAKVAERWNGLAAAGSGGVMAQVAPHLRDLAQWFLSRIGGIGATVVQLLLTVVITAILYLHGEAFSRAVRRFAHRVGGASGERAVDLAGAAIRGIALGVVVTAVAQTALSGLGLMIAGVPFAPILTAVMLILCIAQIGPMLVLIPVVIWGFSHLPLGWGIFLLVWTLFAGTLDNWLRPMLIRRGVDLPLLLIFAGVIGGLLAFGLIGIFVGPVALAITYTLLGAWVDGPPQEAAAPAQQ